MSVEEVSDEREIRGFVVTVAKKCPMSIVSITSVRRDIKEFLDKIEMMEEE